MNKLTLAGPIYLAILLILVAFLGAGPGLAQNLAAPGRDALSAPQQQGQGPTDPIELETFLDGLMAEQMEEYNIAGAAVSVVKDGELFFAKGYGNADLENGTPVDPERTGFFIGSVTKLITWTAVMQLVEQGVLDLEADVNTYLDFQIPDTYPEPIKLKHLLAHTSGFEYLFYENLIYDVDELVPAGEWLASHIPARMRPPGVVASYANYNAGLAAYIVGRVSGLPYDQYIQENILDPLGMENTTARSPVPPDLDQLRSVAYTYQDGAFQALPDWHSQPAAVPTGGILSSATDMARFMIAHLQNGRYSDENIADARILEEATAQQMHSPLFTHDPRIQGNAHGFWDFSDNGQWTIGHNGEVVGYNNNLLLLPDQNLGIFVTYNSQGASYIINQHLGFMRAFFDHYYPAEVAPIEPPDDFAERAGRFTGGYEETNTGATTIERVRGLFSPFTISDPGDGTLLFASQYGEWRMVEMEPLFFRQVDGEMALVFHEDDSGSITHMFWSAYPQVAFEKVNGYETPGFHMMLILGCLLIFLSQIIAAPISAIWSRRRGSDRESAPRGARVARWIAVGISILNVLFVIGTMLWGDPAAAPLFGVPLLYQIVLGLGVLAAVLTIGALVFTVLAWKDSYWGIAGRVYYTLVTLAAVAFVWFLNYWNLLGWRF